MRWAWLGVMAAIAVLLAWNGMSGRETGEEGVADGVADHRKSTAGGTAGDPAPEASMRTAPRSVGDRDGDGASSPDTLQAMVAWEHAYRSAIRRHLEARAAAGDAHAQLTLALVTLAPGGGLSDPTALERRGDAEAARRAASLARALDMAPDDPLVAWHVAEDCGHRLSSCDMQAALQRLRELDADNAAVWLPGLDKLLESGDVEALDRQLALFADAGRFDDLLASTGRLLAGQLADVPIPDPGADLRQGIGERMGLGRPMTVEELRYVPALGVWMEQAAAATTTGLSRACIGPAALADPALCRRAAARMGAGSSLVERAVGLVLQVQLTADRPEGARWREALRRHYWQYEQLMASAGGASPPGYLRRILADGEVAALEWRLARVGQAEPPAGWLPSNPRHRALVTTGRPPPGD
ncbi:hypothetical protein [Marilutibacter chinensis]|uniref:DUF4034 domain-containing protein n=1 Tax=Marilutibacter chinensis TaxID=2912247 RepID=A0ABS9HVJ7_9GAMM|nr:hypothetical protein [Lysobacter chinensis]MCF7222906.1 hypothetical protein [Lysobacter chinensis]